MPRVNLPRECEPWELDLALEIVTSPRHSRLPYSTDAKLCLCGARPALDQFRASRTGPSAWPPPSGPNPPSLLLTSIVFPFSILLNKHTVRTVAHRGFHSVNLYTTPTHPFSLGSSRLADRTNMHFSLLSLS